MTIGPVAFGGDNPIRVQSMTTTDTMDTAASVEQSIRMIEAGCDLVRLTAPSKKDAENLRAIKAEINRRGFNTPLVADIHFTPNAAEIAAQIVEKVRVNPGNYADKKKFEEIAYTDASYEAELLRIEEKFTPLIRICKKNGTAMRVGTNHGSLSDRVLSRYGDTPEGMVESAMEFLRICVNNDYHEIVLSMKASNTIVMVQAYRLLVDTMRKEGMNYPLHLGVTEAGDGEDGRIKSAVGIGALLEDGLGDTVRVSLTEEPEAEIPVAQKLIAKYSEPTLPISSKSMELSYDPFHYSRRETTEIINIGGSHVPRVVCDLSHVRSIKPAHLFNYGYGYSVPLDKWNISDLAADILYIGDQQLPFSTPGTLTILANYQNWKANYQNREGTFPLVSRETITHFTASDIVYVSHEAMDRGVDYLLDYPNAIVCLRHSKKLSRTQYFRNFRLNLAKKNIKNPVILVTHETAVDPESFQLLASADLGIHFIDGFGDGVWLTGKQPAQLINSTAFGILQATRTRISKTEYISCPSCGRTLFDLQETTAKIRAKTSHLKGVKIGIMGCIVNGPGEMADADYGYVGTRPGKIHLYKAKEVVRKNVDESDAVDALIDLIREHGDWIDPQ